MVKRTKRLAKGIESLKKEIENHFKKLDKDIFEGDEISTGYHIKEIDKSLITALESKIKIFENSKDMKLIKEYRIRLEKYKNKLNNS